MHSVIFNNISGETYSPFDILMPLRRQTSFLPLQLLFLLGLNHLSLMTAAILEDPFDIELKREISFLPYAHLLNVRRR